MKKILIGIILCTVTNICAQAQVSAYPHTINHKVKGYSLPKTVINISVVQEQEVIIRGPYANYAKTFLGVVGAPLSDKESYKILDANISWSTEPDTEQIFEVDQNNGTPIEVFEWIITPQNSITEQRNYTNIVTTVPQVPFADMGANTVVENKNGVRVDRTTALEKSEEQMAAEAADMIFKLRKKRIELITAEQGEHVFGAGLSVALEEINRLETQYTELFLGKRIVHKSQKTFRIIPTENQTMVVAFRFSTEKGVVDPTDITANPVNITLSPPKTTPKPQNTTTQQTQEEEKKQAKKGEKTIPNNLLKIRVPVTEKATLTDGLTVFATELIPVYQRGEIVEIPQTI